MASEVGIVGVALVSQWCLLLLLPVVVPVTSLGPPTTTTGVRGQGLAGGLRRTTAAASKVGETREGRGRTDPTSQTEEEEEHRHSLALALAPSTPGIPAWVSAEGGIEVEVAPAITHTSITQNTQAGGGAGGGVNLTLELRAPSGSLLLDLHPSRDLLASTYRDPAFKDGKPGGLLGWCEYQGKVRGDPTSLVALSLCQGVRGLVVIFGRQLEVSPQPAPPSAPFSLDGPHLITSPALALAPSSGLWRPLEISPEDQDQTTHPRHRVERAALEGGRLWTNATTRFIELVLVADNSFYKKYTDTATTRCRTIANFVNALYHPLGVVVVLTHLEMWESSDKMEVVAGNSNTTIDNFRAYRKEFMVENPDVPNDNMQLLTTVEFEKPVMGKGIISGMCSYNLSVGIISDNGLIGSVAQTVAHEIGHNLGLNHDDEDPNCDCDNNRCIMMSSKGSHLPDSHWSECSRKNLTASFRTFALDCLKNIPNLLHSDSCGDGVVGDGEECDCGPPLTCNNPCCNAMTCKLQANATCASGPCCDVTRCAVAPSGTVCREAANDCDWPETCGGVVESCPDDVWEWDGAWCDGGQGRCYHGECGSQERRCVQVWGEDSTPGPPECYTHNTQGRKQANCGYSAAAANTLLSCATEDAKCGTLHCLTPEEGPPRSSLAIYLLWKSASTCRSIQASQNYPTSFWLTPDGTPCGIGKMCVSQHCVDVPVSWSWVVFWLVVVLVAILTVLLWEHIRWCWLHKGIQHCCTVHLPYCASCLDACCCPCMTRLNLMVQALVPHMSSLCGRRRRKSQPNTTGTTRANPVANGDLHPAQTAPVDPWGNSNGQTPFEVVTYTANGSLPADHTPPTATRQALTETPVLLPISQTHHAPPLSQASLPPTHTHDYGPGHVLERHNGVTDGGDGPPQAPIHDTPEIRPVRVAPPPPQKSLNTVPPVPVRPQSPPQLQTQSPLQQSTGQPNRPTPAIPKRPDPALIHPLRPPLPTRP